MIRLLLSSIVLAALLYIGFRPVGPVPAMGPFLDPVHGVWSGVGGVEFPDTAVGVIGGLGTRVRVLYDDRAVPHIFASTVLDATRALGYVVARDRLFQLDLQIRATEGVLSETVGAAALPVDRSQRALGLAWAAERNYTALDPASDIARTLQAYADGVNAWIDNMRPRDMPLEYHLVGTTPRRWRPQYPLYLLKRMGWILAFNATERRKHAAAALVGWDAADALFPLDDPIQEPMQPNGLGRPRVDRRVIPAPGTPDATSVEAAARLSRLFDAPMGFPTSPTEGVICSADPWSVGCPSADDVVLGSNNWAAGPTKTASGAALLSGDPHLGLTLPSIWYEVHMVVPGELDVYGVTIPGMPGVSIGFNRNIAWSMTNTGSDVLDLYAETVNDDDMPSSYQVDGAWQPLVLRVEEYRSKSGALLATDTIYHTHRGPVLVDDGSYYSMRWTVLEEQGEFAAFKEAATASTVDEWLVALESYLAPTQNGLVADKNGSIAIRASGRYPIRPGDGRGDRIRDGSEGASDWIGDLSVSQYPGSIDPGQGFLASANQQPVDSRATDVYLGSDWPSPWRAMRINELLRQTDGLEPEDFERFQTDPGSARADVFVPAFLVAAESIPDSGGADPLLTDAARLLAEWDRRYTKDNTRAVLFEFAMSELSRRTWDELDDHTGDPVRRVSTPSSSVLAVLLGNPESIWWDRKETGDVVERRDDILNQSLVAALERARSEFGDENAGGWRWDGIRHANIYHLLRVPAFSAVGLPVQGGPSTLSPSSGGGTHGPSWRMVVELGDEVTARTIYPGGQSGNPLSSRYRDRIDRWVAGELESVLFPRSPDELGDRVWSVLTLEPR
jgi:penicillin amidase